MSEMVKVYIDGIEQEVELEALGLPDQSKNIDFYKKSTLQDYIAKIDSIANALTSGIPKAEKDSWTSKADAARAFLDGTANEDQLGMLDAERQWTGETREELVQAILSSSAVFSPVSGNFAGMRRLIERNLDRAKTQEELSNVVKMIDSKINDFMKSIGLEN